MGYPNYASTQRSLSASDGAAARQAWLDRMEDEIAMDRDIELSRLYGLIGTANSDRLVQ